MLRCTLQALILFSSVCLIGAGCNSSGGSQGGDGGPPAATLAGRIDTVDFTIPVGLTTSVIGDLAIHASGRVVIDGDLVAEPAAQTNGFNIIIEADGDIDIGGTIRAGGPVSASARGNSDGRATRTVQGADVPAPNTAGFNGGSIGLTSLHGNITLKQNASILGMSGTDGGSGVTGAPGGNGGSVWLCAAKKLTVRGSINLGDGGNGGDAALDTATMRAFFTLLGLPQEFGNRGGDSGFLYAVAGTYDWPGFKYENGTSSIDWTAYMVATTRSISGGYGGSAGMVLISDPPTTMAERLTRLMNHEAVPPDCETPAGEDAAAARGGHGWMLGGVGGFITYLPQLWNGLDGVRIEVRAGAGGNVRGRGDPEAECGNGVVAVGAIAGPGGTASATGVVGLPVVWPGGDPNGGKGGSVVAVGGAGGEASTDVTQTGGSGGTAYVIAGAGGDGRSTCFTPGDGGEGGYADALGGPGGDGHTPGEGGTAEATGGTGGAGGHGEHQAGQGGDGGLCFAKFGADGRSYRPGEVVQGGGEFPGQGENGQPGEIDYYASPDYCASVDYECPDGPLCGM